MAETETLSIRDAAAMLGLKSRNQLYRAIEGGFIEEVLVGGKRHVRRVGLKEAWAKVPRTKANHPPRTERQPADLSNLRPVEQRTAKRPTETTETAGHAAGIDLDEMPDYNVSRARSEFEKANLLELDRKTKEGQLLKRDDVTQAWNAAVNITRTKILGVPSRAKQQIPHLSADEVELVRDLLREALDELSAGEVAA